MEWVFVGSGRSRHKFDSDITGWNQLDWKRNIDILNLWKWSCVEWHARESHNNSGTINGSGRSRHSAFDSDITGWNYMDWVRTFDILN
jgi:hypothetical protein